MIRFDIITLFAPLFAPFLQLGVSGRAFQRGRVRAVFWNPREFADNRHRSVDDRPFGGGSGMVLSPRPMAAVLRAAKQENDGAIIHLTPRGEVFDDDLARRLAQELEKKPALILLCGRYRGIDERVCEKFVEREISIGDYVLSGGELAAMVLMESVLRHIPGVLGNEESADEDAFADGLLDAPCYTRPEIFEEMAAPKILLSGNHSAVEEWRRQEKIRLTKNRRPDLLKKAPGKQG